MNEKNRLLWRFFKLDTTNTHDRNAWYLVVEMFWASIMSSIGTFNAAYAIRLGADNFQTSLLTSIPALMAVLVSYPAGQFLQRRPHRTPWVFGSLAIYRTGFLLVALAPWLHMFGIQSGMTAVLILIAISAPAHFFNVGWFSMLPEIVPEQRRAAIFAARNIVNQATLSVMTFLCGQWLVSIKFPSNYQTLYVIGFVASMISSYCLIKLRVPDSPAPAEEPDGERPRNLVERAQKLRKAAAGFKRDLDEHPAFRRITVNTLLHGLGIWMASALYTLYYVRVLNASDAWLGLNGMIASLGTIVGYNMWRWLLNRWGEPVSLKRTIVLVGVYPLLVGLTPSLPIILIYGALNGLIVPGTNLSHFNTLLKVTPPDERPRYSAIYITTMNIGAFISPMIAIVISNVIGLAATLAAAGLLSVIGSTSFWWNPVHAQKKEEPGLIEASA